MRGKAPGHLGRVEPHIANAWGPQRQKRGAGSGIIHVNGRIKAPHVHLPNGGALGSVIKSIGRAVAGQPSPTAHPTPTAACSRRGRFEANERHIQTDWGIGPGGLASEGTSARATKLEGGRRARD